MPSKYFYICLKANFFHLLRLCAKLSEMFWWDMGLLPIGAVDSNLESSYCHLPEKWSPHLLSLITVLWVDSVPFFLGGGVPLPK